MTTIVTGANGFIGENLINALSGIEERVIACQSKRGALQNLPKNIELISFDLANVCELESLIRAYKPRKIFHLAAQSSPTYSWGNVSETMNLNYSATTAILDAVRNYSNGTVVVLTSSSAIYEESLIPIKEVQSIKPTSPYGVSKSAMEQLAVLYSQAYGTKIMIARPFYIVGPKKIGDVCSDWARQIVVAERRGGGEIAVGEITGVIRDFISVSDGVAGLLAISNHGKSGEAYNISSGNGTSLEYVLNYFIKNSKVKIEKIIDPNKLRPIPDTVKIGNNSKLKNLGWSQSKSVNEVLDEILDYWRINLII